MLPFTCGARSCRYIRSTLKFSAKLSKTGAGRTRQVKHSRTISVFAASDRQCSNTMMQEILMKNEVRMLSLPAYNLSGACSSILLLTSDGGNTSLTLTGGAGDDDEVTTSAGKKRKHWRILDVKGDTV